MSNYELASSWTFAPCGFVCKIVNHEGDEGARRKNEV
jgi:hypothetical protein